MQCTFRESDFREGMDSKRQTTKKYTNKKIIARYSDRTDRFSSVHTMTSLKDGPSLKGAANKDNQDATDGSSFEFSGTGIVGKNTLWP